MSHPNLSVVVPFCGHLDQVEACLRSLRASHYRDYEIILADDGGPDAHVAELVAPWRPRLVRLPVNSGPAAARNLAAREARAPILVFIDSDETVHPDTLGRIAQAFAADPSLTALVGSYDSKPHVTGCVATFRNLLHACVHHRSAGEITTFWAGCGAVRRDQFDALGGFDESFRRPSIEDVDFGFRLHEAGGRILLDPSIQVSHHKQWTIATMVSTDVLRRAVPWTELMARRGLPTNLNFRWRDRCSVLLSASLPLFAALGLADARWLAPLAAALLAILWLEWRVCVFLARARNPWFALVCFPLLLLHFASAAAGFGLGALRLAWLRSQGHPARPGPALVACAEDSPLSGADR